MSNNGCALNENNDKSKDHLTWSKENDQVSNLINDNIKSDSEFNDVGPDDDLVQIHQHLKQDIDFSHNCDTLFNDLLSEYINDFSLKSKSKRLFKQIFFYFVLTLIFIITVIIPSVTFCFFYNSGNLISVQFLIAMITSLIECLTTIMILPKIIARYLFNRVEDKNLVNIISNMQTYNSERHKIISETKLDQRKS